ncbi:hypothetical protein VPH35_026704 [Triticum aestivum]
MLLKPYHLVAPLVLLLVAAVRCSDGSDDGRQFVLNGFAGANLTLGGASTVMPNGLLMLTNGATGKMKGHAFHPSLLLFSSGLNGTGPVWSFSTTFCKASSSNINRYFGVDGDSLVSLSSANTGYYDDDTGQLLNLSVISWKAIQVWVDYDNRAKIFTMTMAPLGMHDIRGILVVMRNITSGHFILGWSFALDGPVPVLDISVLPALPSAWTKTNWFNSPSISMSLKLVLALALMTLVSVGIRIYVIVRWRLNCSEVQEDWEVLLGPKRFSYEVLFHVTEGFNEKNLLGRGGFGSVYTGVIHKPDMELTVKRMSHDSRQGVKEFIAEVVSIGRLRHRNIAQWLGYCRCKGELLLVYDYMKNGSLYKYLHTRNGPTLCWSVRYSIIKGVASSLLYLHEEWEQVIIHRDIKASNVLLDSKLNGQLGDFGLARIYDNKTAAQTTHVAGTMGYLALELLLTGRPTPFSDVTCGRRPIFINEQNNTVLLVEWLLEHHHNNSMLDTVDPRLGGEFNMEEVNIVLKLGLLCTYLSQATTDPYTCGLSSRNARPVMRKVMQYLDHDQSPPDLSPTYISYITMTQMQNKGFDSHNMSCSQPASSVATMSGESPVTILQEGR